MPLITVIIPIHRVDPEYLEKCLNSLKAQDFTDFEALLVFNDSTDIELDVGFKYSTNDIRFTSYQLDIADVSTARNIGLQHAQGKYITFLDSDDWFADNALSTIVDLMATNHVDMGLANTQKIWSENKREYLLKLPEGTVSINIKHIPNLAICGYIFRKDLIDNFSIHFKEKLKLSEDRVFIYEYISHSNTISLSNTVVYNYRQHSNSVCHERKQPKDVIQQYYAAQYIHEIFSKNKKIKRCLVQHIKRETIRMGMVSYIKSGASKQGFKILKDFHTTSYNKSHIEFYYCWIRAHISYMIGKILGL